MFGWFGLGLFVTKATVITGLFAGYQMVGFLSCKLQKQQFSGQLTVVTFCDILYVVLSFEVYLEQKYVGSADESL